MSQINIEFYGRLADIFGRSLTVTPSQSPTSLADLRNQLAEDYDCPEIRQPSIRALLNETMACDTAEVSENQLVTFLSPLSGG